jgi:hypothetical protein
MNMAEQASSMSRHDLEAKIVKRCWQDEEFRKEFTANPAGAFVNYLRIPAASLPKVFVHLEKPGSWHIVLPVKPASQAEFSERELEMVVAGASTFGCVSMATAIFATVLASALGPDEGW